MAPLTFIADSFNPSRYIIIGFSLLCQKEREGNRKSIYFSSQRSVLIATRVAISESVVSLVTKSPRLYPFSPLPPFRSRILENFARSREIAEIFICGSVRFLVQFSVSVSTRMVDAANETFPRVRISHRCFNIIPLFGERSKQHLRYSRPEHRRCHDGSFDAQVFSLKFALCRGAARQAEVFPWEIRGPCYPDKLQFPELPSASLWLLPGVSVLLAIEYDRAIYSLSS